VCTVLGMCVTGEVTSIASVGEFIFVGGEFTAVSGIAVNRIARYQLGRWYPLRQGLNGRVNSLAAIGACLYMGGAFTATVAEPQHDPEPLSYATRWCLDLVTDAEPSFEGFGGMKAAGPIQDIVSLHMYTQEVQPPAGFVCPLGDNTTHCTSPLKN
jgi:hypothetical protein